MSKILTGKGLDAGVFAVGAGRLVQADAAHTDVALQETRACVRAAAASDTHKMLSFRPYITSAKLYLEDHGTRARTRSYFTCSCSFRCNCPRRRGGRRRRCRTPPRRCSCPPGSSARRSESGPQRLIVKADKQETKMRHWLSEYPGDLTRFTQPRT